MKETLRELVREAAAPGHARNLAREYLQARILGRIQREGGMIPLAFHGGTALRFLYRLPRFSEDLDFTLERERAGFDLRTLMRAVGAGFEAEGYRVNLKLSERRTVHSAALRFVGLLYELGLSPRPQQVLSIKVEVDTRPPAGATCETTVIRRHVTLQLQHHDRASLLAGKLHAFLQRPYAKGRDLFDLLWYLADPEWPEPNLTMLGNALRQTGWQAEVFTAASWRSAVGARLAGLDWRLLRTDVAPFLEPGSDPELLDEPNLRRLLERGAPR
ncbi:MAG: nucleotidyl transferase AbiEii/AbiGii toxin family protein [Deltaproteobacteria bacterium]|nr:nucleotidyl transferase AbiEii/AbiGii toxin family protein [Deltaproteobacteria bacterium]